jgi:hypothetical protein
MHEVDVQDCVAILFTVSPEAGLWLISIVSEISFQHEKALRLDVRSLEFPRSQRRHLEHRQRLPVHV